MKSSLRRACLFAAFLALSLPAAANDGQSPAPVERFVLAFQEQRFDEAAAMFKPRDTHDTAAIAAQLKQVASRLGGLASMRNLPSLPNGGSFKLVVPSAPLAPRPGSYHQVTYQATAADSQPVFYILALDPAPVPQRVLWLEIHLPTPDADATTRAAQVLRDLI